MTIEGKGDQVHWTDVNGHEHSGEVIGVIVVYKVKTDNDRVMEISKKL